MKVHRAFLNPVVAALGAVLWLAPVASADPLADMFDQLKSADGRAAARLEREIWNEWSKSGSPAMDLLLQRGRDAMEAGNMDEAVEHLTALTDHAPDFAEGWNARATAYYRARQFGPSVADIARALTLNPQHFGALAGLGAIYEELEKPEQALAVYRAALAIHPNLGGVSQSIERLEAKVAGTDL
jgi:tetratricopeptide (TPR) repeat protein